MVVQGGLSIPRELEAEVCGGNALSDPAQLWSSHTRSASSHPAPSLQHLLPSWASGVTHFLHMIPAPIYQGHFHHFWWFTCPMSYINSDVSERRYTLLWHKYFPVLKLYFRILSYTFGKWRKIRAGDEWSIMIQASWPLAFCKFNSTGSCIENYTLWDDCLHRVCTHRSQVELSGRTQTACICLFTTSIWSGWCGRNCVNHLLGSMTLFSIFHGGVEREQAVHPQAQLCRWSQCDGKHISSHLWDTAPFSSLVEDRWNKHQGSYQLWNSITPWGFNKGAIGGDVYTSTGTWEGEMNAWVPLWKHHIPTKQSLQTECLKQLYAGRGVAQPSSLLDAAWGAVSLLMRTIYLLSCPCAQAVRSRRDSIICWIKTQNASP